MKEYSKPLIDVVRERAEGVYATSGGVAYSCQSQYMKGVYHAPNNDGWTGGTLMSHFGCHGCTAYTDSGCGLQGHYIDADKAASYAYDFQMEHLMPSWEYHHKTDTDPFVPGEEWKYGNHMDEWHVNGMPE